MTAAVEHLAALDTPRPGPRRERVLASMAAAPSGTSGAVSVLLDGLGAMGKVTLYGAARNRTATAYFTVAGRPRRRWPHAWPSAR